MIMQTTELSPSQRAAVEQSAGRKLQDSENIVLCGGALKVASAAGRQNALLQARHQLLLLDPSERRLSIEQWMAALLGDTGTEATA